MRAFLLSFISLTFAGTLYAACTGPNTFDTLPASTRSALTQQAARAPYSQGLLWQVEKDGVTSHLIGTFHMFLPEHADTVARLRALSMPFDQVLFELNRDGQADFQRHLADNPDMYLIGDGPSLIDQLGPENWAKVSAQLMKRDIPPFLAAKYQPWFLGFMLMVPACMSQDTAANRHGLDRQIEAMADALGLPTASLDSPQSLLDILASDPMDKQVADMRWSLELDLEMDGASQVPSMIDMYLGQDVQLIWEYSKFSILANLTKDADAQRLATLLNEIKAKLIVSRNTAWAKTLVPELSQTPSLVAVGAMHLPGNNGLLAQLERAGFSVTRLPLHPD